MNNNIKVLPNYNLVRLIACFLVVLHHVIAYFEIQKGMYFPLVKMFSSTCVPLFVLLSGALLIPKSENYKLFYSKRIKSIAIPFVFWIAFYTIFRLITAYLNNETDTLLIYKNLIGIDGWPYYHLWYIYLILFLYLITPVLKKIINLFPKQYYLLAFSFLFVIFCLIALNYHDVLFTNYIALYIMGGFIAHIYNKNNSFLILFLIMLVILGVGFFMNLEFLISNSLAIVFFLMIIKIPLKAVWIDFFIPLTLGIYLLHPLVLKVIAKVSIIPQNVISLTLLVFIGTAIIIFLTKKIKYLRAIC